MISLKINKALVTPLAAEALIKVCPFSAITYEDETLDIGAGCRMCKLCVKKGPEGVVSLVETHDELVDKSLWNGVCVYAEAEEGTLHPVTFELIGKARELAAVTKHEVYALLIGHNTEKNVKTLLEYGVDRVYVYDYPEFADFVMLPYSNAFEDFIERVKPSSVLVGATNVGRSLAPRIAARFRTGLTADCTVLEMYENTDLVQIRPAFGGNIMAKILCPKTRPQLCTVRYKIFSAPAKTEPHGEVFRMELAPEKRETTKEVLEVIKKAKEKNLPNTKFIVGDCEKLPFEDESFDVIICTNSFHHYPNPQDFLDNTYRALRKGGRLILRDYTSSDLIVWLMNHIELPLAHLVGHGDVKIYKKEEYREMLKKAGFRKMKVVREEKFRCHVVAVKL